MTTQITPLAQYLGGSNRRAVYTTIDTMTDAELRAALHRVANLLTAGPTGTPPPDGSLVIVGTSGGHQDQPYRERAYVRSDDADATSGTMSAQQRADGDWYRVGDERSHRLTWGGLNWFDDPECDRGDVSIDGHYLHDSAIAAAILGETP